MIESTEEDLITPSLQSIMYHPRELCKPRRCCKACKRTIYNYQYIIAKRLVHESGMAIWVRATESLCDD